ncbi:MAG: hypothetical protein H8D78_15385 [Chloroflexi bacterium]|nr:hypothetical protein [Chloroflexota bacterium]
MNEYVRDPQHLEKLQAAILHILGDSVDSDQAVCLAEQLYDRLIVYTTGILEVQEFLVAMAVPGDVHPSALADPWGAVAHVTYEGLLHSWRWREELLPGVEDREWLTHPTVFPQVCRTLAAAMLLASLVFDEGETYQDELDLIGALQEIAWPSAPWGPEQEE